jgi:hypothetical protein
MCSGHADLCCSDPHASSNRTILAPRRISRALSRHWGSLSGVASRSSSIFAPRRSRPASSAPEMSSRFALTAGKSTREWKAAVRINRLPTSRPFMSSLPATVASSMTSQRPTLAASRSTSWKAPVRMNRSPTSRPFMTSLPATVAPSMASWPPTLAASRFTDTRSSPCPAKAEASRDSRPSMCRPCRSAAPSNRHFSSQSWRSRRPSAKSTGSGNQAPMMRTPSSGMALL